MATYDFSNAIPYVPTHVGELINDELVASGLSVEQLSEKANIELIALNETISGKRQLSTEMALQIESVMGIPASLLLNIQIQYNSFSAEKMNILRRKLSFFKLSHITLPKQICYIIHQQHPKQEHCHTASYLQSFQYLVLLQPLAMFDDDND